MILRPIATRWFELVIVPANLARAVECLSRTGAVQLESRSGRTEELLFADIGEQLRAFHELARRYQPYWPPATVTEQRRTERLNETLSAARHRLAAWAEKADPIIVSIEQLSHTADDLDRLNNALAVAGRELPDLKLLTGCGPRLRARLLEVPPGTKLRELPALVLFRTWENSRTGLVLVVGRKDGIDEIEGHLAGLKGRIVPLPDWLPAKVESAIETIRERRAQIAHDIQTHEERLAALSDELQIASALGDITFIEWFNLHASDLRGSQRLAWVTGWTSDLQGAALRRALDAEAIRYVLRLAKPPLGTDAPMVLSNPSWARAFEVFPRMLGMPARGESDPSPILAVIVPIIFGFMFGDVGQGLVITLTGMLLGRRFPHLKMLVPGGIVAIAFGFLFGSVFSREDLILAVWLRPLANPIAILVAALAFGATILIVGMLLQAVQAHWRGEWRLWWGHRVGLLVCYVGLLFTPFEPVGLVFVAIGAAWFLLGSVALAEKRNLGRTAGAAGEFVEETLRLSVNTLSFARLGAFALGHAGLSLAVIEIALATGPLGYWIVLVLGNAVIIALEGLVVGIQTTRLVLFEFFIRFLTAGGREFKPLSPPEVRNRALPGQSIRSTS